MSTDLIYRLRKLSQQHSYVSLLMHETVARKAGLPGTDHKYLGFLLEKGSMTAGELAILTGLTTGAVTGLIDRFETKGLLKRTYAKDDRRKVIIEPDTEKIKAIFGPLYKDFRDRTESLIASFSPDEIKIIETYFLKTIDVITEATHKLNSK